MSDELDQPEDEPGYTLEMPFVTVVSHGGPHDDEAYAAGWEMGRLDAILAVTGEWSQASTWTIQAANLAQADLIAMRHGFTLSVVDDSFEEWRQIVLAKDVSDATDVDGSPDV